MHRLLRGMIDRPIHVKLMLIAFATAALAMTVSSALLMATNYFYYREELERELQAQTAIIAQNISAAVVFGDAENAREILAALRLTPDVEEGEVYAAEGVSLAQYRRPQAVGHSGWIPEQWLSLELRHPVVVQAERRGTVRVRAGLGRVYARVIEQLGIVWAVALVSLGIAFLLLARLRRAITDPLSRLVQVTQAVSERRDYAQRAAVEGRDEIGALARGFNAMLGEIERHQRELAQELFERRRTEEQLDRLAHFDSVTELPNRNYFGQYLRNAVARSLRRRASIGLMFVDVDNFKIINDTLGHHVGDDLLKRVAERLNAALRSSDTVCRFGGDEFAIVLEDLPDPEEARRVAQRVVGAFGAPFRVGGDEIYVTVSAGVALCPEHAADVPSLQRQADAAMHRAKESGRNAFSLYTDDMRMQAVRRLAINNSLHRALDRAEFVLHYQPVIDLASGRVKCAEALLRWRHPELGLLGPVEFIAIAEADGLIVPLGEWVLDAACAQARKWEERGYPLRVAVNVASRQCRDADLVGAVRRALERHQLRPSQLALELTETALIDGSDGTRTKLRELDTLGVQLGIDDFGTGYSSMSYLRSMPIRLLKVDRSLVTGIPGDRDGEAIMDAIVAMARSLELEVVAEGVETAAQADHLKRYARIGAQGYYFSHPLSADDMTAFLESDSAVRLRYR